MPNRSRNLKDKFLSGKTMSTEIKKDKKAAKFKLLFEQLFESQFKTQNRNLTPFVQLFQNVKGASALKALKSAFLQVLIKRLEKRCRISKTKHFPCVYMNNRITRLRE